MRRRVPRRRSLAADVFCAGVGRGYLAECRETGLRGFYGEGAVNERPLAGVLGLRASEAEVVRGASSRDKVVLARVVAGERAGESLERLVEQSGEHG